MKQKKKITLRELIEADGRWFGGISPFGWYLLDARGGLKFFWRTSSSFQDWKGIFGTTV